MDVFGLIRGRDTFSLRGAVEKSNGDIYRECITMERDVSGDFDLLRSCGGSLLGGQGREWAARGDWRKLRRLGGFARDK